MWFSTYGSRPDSTETLGLNRKSLFGRPSLDFEDGHLLYSEIRMLEGSITESLEGGIAATMPGRALAYGPLKLRYKALTNFNDLAQKEALSELARNRMPPFETLSAIHGGISSLAAGNIA